MTPNYILGLNVGNVTIAISDIIFISLFLRFIFMISQSQNTVTLSRLFTLSRTLIRNLRDIRLIRIIILAITLSLLLGACGKISLSSLFDESKLTAALEGKLAKSNEQSVDRIVEELSKVIEDSNSSLADIAELSEEIVIPTYVSDNSRVVATILSADSLSTLPGLVRERVSYLLDNTMSILSNLKPQQPVTYDPALARIEALLGLSRYEGARSLALGAISAHSIRQTVDNDLLVINYHLDPAFNFILDLNLFYDPTSDPNTDTPDLDIPGSSLLRAHPSALSITDTQNDTFFHLAPYSIVGLFRRQDKNNGWGYHAFVAGIESPAALPATLKGSATYATTHALPLFLAAADFSKTRTSRFEHTAEINVVFSDSAFQITRVFLPFSNHPDTTGTIPDISFNFFSRIELKNTIDKTSMPFSRISVPASDLLVKYAAATGIPDQDATQGEITMQFYGRQYNVLAGVMDITTQIGTNPEYRIFGVFVLESKS